VSAVGRPAEPTTAAVYPLPRAAGGDDARFTLGLALDIAAVLARHGYPRVTNGRDLVHWQLALHAAIYALPAKETP
jgi:hypothetical protein